MYRDDRETSEARARKLEEELANARERLELARAATSTYEKKAVAFQNELDREIARRKFWTEVPLWLWTSALIFGAMMGLSVGVCLVML